MSKGVSLNPESFVEGGGLIDDVDVTFKETLFDMFDYNGTVTPGVPSLKVTLDVEGEEMIQYYSMGASKDWAPSEDGKMLIAVGSATGIRMSSNGGIFLKALIDSGFPADKLGNDISILDGLQAHVIRIPAPSRPGVKKSDKQKEREEKFGPDTILVVSEINTLPWEKSKPAGAPKTAKAGAGKKAAPKAKAEASGGNDDIDGKLQELIMGMLAEEPVIEIKKLPIAVFKAAKTDPDRNAMVQRAAADEFLSSGPWEMDDGNLIMG